MGSDARSPAAAARRTARQACGGGGDPLPQEGGCAGAPAGLEREAPACRVPEDPPPGPLPAPRRQCPRLVDSSPRRAPDHSHFAAAPSSNPRWASGASAAAPRRVGGTSGLDPGRRAQARPASPTAEASQQPREGRDGVIRAAGASRAPPELRQTSSARAALTRGPWSPQRPGTRGSPWWGPTGGRVWRLCT